MESNRNTPTASITLSLLLPGPFQSPPVVRKPHTSNRQHCHCLSKQRLRAPELGVFMQSRLARGPHELYLSNVCTAGDEFREKGLLEDNTQKGEEKSK